MSKLPLTFPHSIGWEVRAAGTIVVIKGCVGKKENKPKMILFAFVCVCVTHM